MDLRRCRLTSPIDLCSCATSDDCPSHLAEQVKKDFVSTELPFSEFKNKLAEFWPKFIAHHNDAKWLDDDFVSMRTHLPRGHVAFVIDFAENYSHEPRFEHQSKYFTQVQTTIVPVVIMLRVEDVNNISSDERDELLALFAKLELPNVISETHFVISSDMQHDNAFIQKALDDHIIPYIMRVSTDVKCIHVRSDGCKVKIQCSLETEPHTIIVLKYSYDG